MNNYKWVFKWKKHNDGDTIFIPIKSIQKAIVKENNYLAIWRSVVPGKFISDWWPESQVIKFKDMKPKSEDLRMVFEYVFHDDNFFKVFK